MDEPSTLEQASAAFVVGFEANHIDADALEDAKRLLKDQLAIQVGASQLPWSKQLRSARQLRPGSATIVADEVTASAADAGYLNASYGHGFEYDDFAGNAHPGCCVVPTAIAVGEGLGSTLGEVVVAMVVGYETYVRIGYLGSPDLLNAGWQPHSVLANFGAAAVVAHLQQLDVDQTLHALAIALSHASGTTEYASTGGSIKRVHAGMAVRNGIESVELARAGITGPLRFLTGDRGLYRNFIRREITDEARSIFDLSEPLKLREMSFKPYCCCAATHAYIDLMDQVRARAADIVAIDARIQTMTDAIVGNRNSHIYLPRTIEELQYSLPAQMALAALGRGNGYRTHRDFLEGKFQLTEDSDIIQFARRITLKVDAELDKKYPRTFAADIRIDYRDGSSQRLFSDAAKGTPGNPMLPAEHQSKLDELTYDVIGQAKAAELFDHLDRLDFDTPIGKVMELVRC